MSLRFIIFDLDGTLVDTAMDLSLALSHAVSPWGLGPFGPEETKPLVGEGLELLIRKALSPLGEQGVDANSEEATERFVAHYTENLTTHTRPYDGVAETLPKISVSFGLAVLSNKRTSMCKAILRNFGLERHFRLIAGGDAVPEKKPSPKAVLHVLDTLGALPGETVFVGDSITDIESAHGAGILSIAVTYGFRQRETLVESDRMVDSFPELVPLLAELRETSS